MEIDNTITCGNSPKNNGIVSHIWLTLDNEGTILDPTIRQFDYNMESVYLGKLTENEVTKKYIPEKRLYEELFKSTYGIWKEPLIDKQPRTYIRPEGFEDKMNLLNIRTASVLYDYIEKIPSNEVFIQKNKCKKYFSPIFTFLRDKLYSDKAFVDKLKNSMPNSFEALLSKALNTN